MGFLPAESSPPPPPSARVFPFRRAPHTPPMVALYSSFTPPPSCHRLELLSRPSCHRLEFPSRPSCRRLLAPPSATPTRAALGSEAPSDPVDSSYLPATSSATSSSRSLRGPPQASPLPAAEPHPLRSPPVEHLCSAVEASLSLGRDLSFSPFPFTSLPNGSDPTRPMQQPPRDLDPSLPFS